jgi:hypothetical protein
MSYGRAGRAWRSGPEETAFGIIDLVTGGAGTAAAASVCHARAVNHR